MSLDRFFEDRSIRRRIRESVYTAHESGRGTCQGCGSRSEDLLNVEGFELCSSCCDDIIEGTWDFDTVFEDANTRPIDLISEAYAIVDMPKLQNLANAQAGGDIKALLTNYYHFKLKSDWNDKLSEDQVWITPQDIKSGQTRFNQFCYDTDAKFARKPQGVVPDPDGTLYTLFGGTANTASASTPSPAIPTPPSPAPAATTSAPSTLSAPKTMQTNIKAGPKSKTPKDVRDFEIELTDKDTLSVKFNDQNQEYDVLDSGGGQLLTVPYGGTSDTPASVTKQVHAALLSDLSLAFGAFERDDLDVDHGTANCSIAKYPAYGVRFTMDSFTGKGLEGTLTYKGAPYTSSEDRILLQGRELGNRALLNATLTSWLDNRLRKLCPALFNGTCNFRTSIGPLRTSIGGVEPDGNNPVGKVIFVVHVANKEFVTPVSSLHFADAETARATVHDTVFVHLGELIPGWDDSSIRDRASSANDAFSTTFAEDGKGFTVHAEFNQGDFYATDYLTFKTWLEDSNGNRYPDGEYATITYKKAGTPMKKFLVDEGHRIYRENAKGSNMGTLTNSARTKLKSPAKRAAFLNKVSSLLKKKLKQVNKDIDDLEVSFPEFDVGRDGKVTHATFAVCDPDNLVANSSAALAKALKLELKCKWIDTVNTDFEDDFNGDPVVGYDIGDMSEFSDLIQLEVLEQLMYEAYNVVLVNESTGRKSLYV